MNPLMDTLMNRAQPPPSQADSLWNKPKPQGGPPQGPPAGGPPPTPPEAPPMPPAAPPAPSGQPPVPMMSNPQRPPPEAQRALNTNVLTKAYQNPAWSPNPVLLQALMNRH